MSADRHHVQVALSRAYLSVPVVDLSIPISDSGRTGLVLLRLSAASRVIVADGLSGRGKRRW